MEVWILEYKDLDGTRFVRFNTHELLWAWLQEFYNQTNKQFPRDMLIYKAECVFDGS